MDSNKTNIFGETDFVSRKERPALLIQTHDDEAMSSGDESDNDDLSEAKSQVQGGPCLSNLLHPAAEVPVGQLRCPSKCHLQKETHAQTNVTFRFLCPTSFPQSFEIQVKIISSGVIDYRYGSKILFQLALMFRKNKACLYL